MTKIVKRKRKRKVNDIIDKYYHLKNIYTKLKSDMSAICTLHLGNLLLYLWSVLLNLFWNIVLFFQTKINT